MMEFAVRTQTQEQTQEQTQAIEETDEQIDNYLEERQRLYEEYREQLKEEERLQEEEAKQAAEKVEKYEGYIEKYQEELDQAAKEGNELVSEHMDLISKEAGEAGGPVFEELSESYEKHLHEGLAWPDEDYKKCYDAIEQDQEEFQRVMEEEAQRSIQKVREEAEMVERSLEEEYFAKEDRIHSQIESTMADYDDRLSKETNPTERERILHEKEEALNRLHLEEEKNSEEYERQSQELAEKNKKKIEEAQASAELFGALAAGGNPFTTPEANEKLQKSKQAVLSNDHKQAVVSAKLHKAEERYDRALKNKERSMIKSQAGENQARATVMKDQINAAPDAATKEKIVASANAELDKSLADEKEKLRKAEKQHADKVYGLAKERKIAQTHAKADTAILQNRAAKYRKTQADIDASMASASKIRQKNLAKEKKDLEIATEMTEKEIRQLQEYTDTKLKDLESKYQKGRKEYQEEKQRLEEKVHHLESLQSEVRALSKQPPRNTDEPLDDLNQSVQSINLSNSDQGHQVGQDTLTSRRRHSENDSQYDTAVLKKLPKQDTRFNKPAKRNVNRLTGDDLRDLNKMKEDGRNLSSTEKLNKVRHGDTYIYDVDDINSLNDTDNTKWANVANSKAAGTEETGKGARRQWTAKGDPDMTKIANHYPEKNLGIVRYSSRKESQKYGIGRGAPERRDGNQRVTEDGASAVNRLNLESTMDVDQDDEVAAPYRQANDNTVVDDYNLSKMVRTAKPEELQDPAMKQIKEPTGGDLYLYKTSGNEKEAKAVKEDNLRWKRNREVHSQNFNKEVYYARDDKSVHSGFQKHVYTSHDGSTMAVHYVGDASLSVPKVGRYSRPQVKDNQRRR